MIAKRRAEKNQMNKPGTVESVERPEISEELAEKPRTLAKNVQKMSKTYKIDDRIPRSDSTLIPSIARY